MEVAGEVRLDCDEDGPHRVGRAPEVHGAVTSHQARGQGGPLLVEAERHDCAVVRGGEVQLPDGRARRGVSQDGAHVVTPFVQR